MRGSVIKESDYHGFEQGPIRPPSEAGSLLIRITRNCPWNRCTFCPVYKGSHFSLRPVAHVLEDIDRVHRYVLRLRENGERDGIAPGGLDGPGAIDGVQDLAARNAALNWAHGGMQSIFLQDANSLVIKPAQLIEILQHLQHRFPWVKRVTSYARSHTVARISDENLRLMAAAGLSRIHIGLESGSDKVLARIKKGVDKKTQIKAGQKIKQAGMELSEYYMPGLGGRDLSMDHARQSADALNQINPDFIRLRTLAIPGHVELYQEFSTGGFAKLNDAEVAEELHVFISNLTGITSTLKSDHILNLFDDLEGRFPEDKEAMLAIIERFLRLDVTEKMYYQVGRRLGYFKTLEDLQVRVKRNHVKNACASAGIHPGNVNEAIDELMRRFI